MYIQLTTKNINPGFMNIQLANNNKFTYQAPPTINNVPLAIAIKELETIYEFLESQRDLSPNNEILNIILKYLVSQITEWSYKNSFTIQDLSKQLAHLLVEMPKLCAIAECDMEKWWAMKMISGEMHLEDFWYLNNYQRLVNDEADLVGQIDSNHKIIFLGSGALPLSALLLSKTNPEYQIICIDRDAQACQLASDLIKLNSLSSQIKVVESDAEGYTYSTDNIVICASLLYAPKIYDHLFKSNVRTLMVRDSEDLYRFLYHPAIKPEKTQYTEIKRTHPNAERINISRYYEKVESAI